MQRNGNDSGRCEELLGSLARVRPDKENHHALPPPCPLCGGISHGLGVLGTLLQCRCEACGWTFGVTAPAGEDLATLEAAATGEKFLR